MNSLKALLDSTKKYVELIKQALAIKMKMMNNSQHVYSLWNDVNIDEIWCYFSVQLLISIIHTPYYHMYWSKESLLLTSMFLTMRHDRFKY